VESSNLLHFSSPDRKRFTLPEVPYMNQYNPLFGADQDNSLQANPLKLRIGSLLEISPSSFPIE